MRRRLRLLIILLGLALGAAALWRAIGPVLRGGGPAVVKLPPGQPAAIPEGGTPEEMPVQVRVFKASKVSFSDTLPVTGTVRGQMEVPLKFEINGVVKAIHFREGELVQHGEAIADLDDHELQLRVEHSQAKLAAAQAQEKLAAHRMAMHERLFQLGAIIQEKLEESKLEHEQAQAQLDTAGKEVELAQADLTKASLKAPMDGVVGTLEVEVGEFVTPQTSVGLLADVTNVFVELGVIERDIEKVKLGQAAKITVDAFPGAELHGTIETLTPVIEGKSRTLTAKVKVPNEKGALLPGMFARAELTVFQKEDALVVPTTALQDQDGDGVFEAVFVVDEAQIAHLHPIQLGYMTTDYAEIASGVEEEEQVVVEARGKLKDGSKVVLLEVEESGLKREEPHEKHVPGPGGDSDH